jgi:hypothetical protein
MGVPVVPETAGIEKIAETKETTAAEVGTEPEAEAPAFVSSAQVKAMPKPAENVYPKYFYENGRKYAYYDEFHENEGMKTLIADESEPNVTSGEVYDWLSDPLKDVPGPFTGNGGN